MVDWESLLRQGLISAAQYKKATGYDLSDQSAKVKRATNIGSAAGSTQTQQPTQLAGDVVPYSRPYNMPQLHGPLDILRALHPYWFVPQGGESIQNWVDRPANSNSNQRG